jgi:hypothetical protein
MLIQTHPSNLGCDRKEKHMESNVGDLVVGLMMAVFGLIGLFLVAGAADNEMYVFGMSLAGFAVCFEFGLIRRHFDRQEARRPAVAVTVREHTHV